MSTNTITRCLIAIGCAAVLPLYAQTTATTTTTTTTTTHKVEHKAKTEVKESKATEKKEMKAEEKKETKAEEKKEMKAEKAEKKATHHMKHTMPMSHGSRVYTDATRLAAVLADTQVKVDVSPAVWKTVANESNTLANRVAAGAKGTTRAAAMDARKHVRQMHAAAMKGDAAGARMHASEALPYIYKVIDATAPSSMHM